VSLSKKKRERGTPKGGSAFMLKAKKIFDKVERKKKDCRLSLTIFLP